MGYCKKLRSCCSSGRGRSQPRQGSRGARPLSSDTHHVCQCLIGLLPLDFLEHGRNMFAGQKSAPSSIPRQGYGIARSHQNFCDRFQLNELDLKVVRRLPVVKLAIVVELASRVGWILIKPQLCLPLSLLPPLTNHPHFRTHQTSINFFNSAPHTTRVQLLSFASSTQTSFLSTIFRPTSCRRSLGLQVPNAFSTKPTALHQA